MGHIWLYKLSWHRTILCLKDLEIVWQLTSKWYLKYLEFPLKKCTPRPKVKKSNLHQKWWKCTPMISQKLSICLENAELNGSPRSHSRLVTESLSPESNGFFIPQKNIVFKYFHSLWNELETSWIFFTPKNQQVYECVMPSIVKPSCYVWCLSVIFWLESLSWTWKTFSQNWHILIKRFVSWFSVFLRKNFDQLSFWLLVQCPTQLVTCPPNK